MSSSFDVNFKRVYKDESANAFIHDYVTHCDRKEFLFEFKKNKEYQQKFMDFLLGNENVSLGDAWYILWYDFAEKKYVESVERERALRKKCNVYAPEDEKEIDLSYVVVM